MICQYCRQSSPGTSAFCTHCGRAQQENAAAFAALAGSPHVSRTAVPQDAGLHERSSFTPQAPTNALSGALYASFLKRFIAFFVDQCIAGGLAFVAYFILAALGALSGSSSTYGRYGGAYRTGASLGFGLLLIVLGGLLAIAVYVYYFVRQETGPRQATLGKLLLGMRVTSASGTTVSIGQSLGRLIIKDTISGVFFGLGFLMAAFTERRQALHDFVAGTIVVER